MRLVSKHAPLLIRGSSLARMAIVAKIAANRAKNLAITATFSMIRLVQLCFWQSLPVNPLFYPTR